MTIFKKAWTRFANLKLWKKVAVVLLGIWIGLGVATSGSNPTSVAESSATESTPSAEPAPKVSIDPIAAAITERYGECLIKLKFTEPFDITVYSSTGKADVSNADYSAIIFFHTGTSNIGNIITIPDEADGSARALASVGC